VAAWLHAKISRTESEETKSTYTRYITQFRDVLQEIGVDLDGDPALISVLVQGWAAHPSRKAKVGPATYNQRIATVSSFYEYAIRHAYLKENPMRLVDRRPVEARDYAQPLEQQDVQQRLQKIDKRTLSGLRDYALLSLAITTGRRSFELAALRLGDLAISGDKVVVTWQRCKGAKVMSDILTPRVVTALITYLGAVYGIIAELPADTPIWLSFARNETKGFAIGKQAISDICKKWLGTSKVHATRHTFAVAMEQAGAKLSDIGNRLGHSNLSTTSEYMKRLHSAENPFSQRLEEMFFGGE
jgi:site-specific recombinase XerD